MSVYYTVLTDVGIAKMVNATLVNQKVDFKEMAVGDGGGNAYKPSQNATSLRNEVWRGNVHLVEQDENNPNWIVIEAAIPAVTGGFHVREIGIYDADGDLVAIGNTPETYKPRLDEGSTKDLYLINILEVSNASAVTLKVDPSAAIANRKYVDDKVRIVSTNLTSLRTDFNNHLDESASTSKKGHVQLSDAVNSTSTTLGATANAVKKAYDLANSKYTKASTGIPKTDLASAVQTSLNKADTALQSVPTATSSVFGLVKTGANITNSSGTISIPNGTKTNKGVLQVGDGLVEVGGIVRALVVRDDNKTTDNLYTEFLRNQTTFSVYYTNFTDVGYVKALQSLNATLGYTLSTSGNAYYYKFEMETHTTNSTEVFQKLRVYSNLTTNSGQLIFTLMRNVNNSTQTWNPWKSVSHTILGNGNPNGVHGGMRGWMYTDIVTAKVYVKSTGLDGAYNQGWLEVGA